MTKKQFYILLSILLVAILIFSNPSEENHIESVKNKVKMAFKKKMASEMIENESNSMQSLGKGLGLLFGDAVIDKMADGFISRDNYFLFSITKADYKGENKIIGLGLLGNVFISDEISKIFNKDEEEKKEEENVEKIKGENKISNELEKNNENVIISKDWKTFNHKYGFSIDLPNNFEEGLLANSGLQWYTLNGDMNDFYICVETIGEGNSESLRNDYKLYSEEKNVSYKVYKSTSFVVSGIDDDEKIYYFKAFVKNNQTHYLRITYPNSMKNQIEPLIARISESFK